jgi:hypothetical protein
MNLILLFSASSSLSHETPPDRIAISRIIPDGEWLSETHSLPEGDLILLTMPHPHGVLSMSSHTGYVIYIGLTPNTGGPTEWFQAPQSHSGLSYFGPNTATIEIVATISTSITYTAYYLGSSRNHCTSVRPASSEIFFENFRNSSSRSCFVITDREIEAHISGSLGTGELIIRSHEYPQQFTNSDPISTGGSTVNSFYAIQFSNSGLNGSTLSLTFKGANPNRDYDELTQESPIGSLGKGVILPFERLTTDPTYPKRPSLAIWISCLLLFVIIPLIISYLRARFFAKSAKSKSPQQQLFDSQAEISDPSPPPTIDIEPYNPPNPPIIHDSPYDSDSPSF